MNFFSLLSLCLLAACVLAGHHEHRSRQGDVFLKELNKLEASVNHLTHTLEEEPKLVYTGVELVAPALAISRLHKNPSLLTTFTMNNAAGRDTTVGSFNYRSNSVTAGACSISSPECTSIKPVKESEKLKNMLLQLLQEPEFQGRGDSNEGTVGSFVMFKLTFPLSEPIHNYVVRAAPSADGLGTNADLAKCFKIFYDSLSDASKALLPNKEKDLVYQTFEAYWVPYLTQGSQRIIARMAAQLGMTAPEWYDVESIGFVDIPEHPAGDQPKIVLTGLQNGCSLVVVRLREDIAVSTLRVFHDSEFLLPSAGLAGAEENMFSGLGTVVCEAHHIDVHPPGDNFDAEGHVIWYGRGAPDVPHSFTWMSFNTATGYWELKAQNQITDARTIGVDGIPIPVQAAYGEGVSVACV